MARKYELISELYDRTCKTVVSNPQSWQKFLESACRNYLYQSFWTGTAPSNLE